MRLIFSSLIILFTASIAHANTVGTHFENFNPTTNGLDFVTVHSSRTLEPGVFNLGGFTDYTFNSVPYFKRPGAPDHYYSEPRNTLWNSHFNLGLGLMDGWDAGISLPVLLEGESKNNTNLGSFGEDGLTEVRLNTKYRVFREENWGAAVVGSVNFDRTKNNPFMGGDAGPTFNVEVAGDYKLSNGWLLGANLGYRIRDRGQTIVDTAVVPLKDAMLFSAAAAYTLAEYDTTIIFEAYGSRFVKSIQSPTDRKSTTLEFLAGAKHMIRPDMAIHAGFALGAVDGPAVPDARLYAGLNWQFGPVWNDPPAPAPAPEPPPVVVVEEKPSEVIVLSSINFATDSTNMTTTSRVAFTKTAEQLNKNVGTIRKIIVEGHTDNVGTDAYNKNLGEGRAKSVQRILAQSLPTIAAQIQAVGLGETRPIASNDSEAGRAQNRRVEIKIYRTE